MNPAKQMPYRPLDHAESVIAILLSIRSEVLLGPESQRHNVPCA
jgi:hypothetical protein